MNDNLELLKVQVNGPLPSKRDGEQTRVPGETHDNQSENRHHVIEVKIHHPNRVSNPHPLVLVISSLGQNVPFLSS